MDVIGRISKVTMVFKDSKSISALAGKLKLNKGTFTISYSALTEPNR